MSDSFIAPLDAQSLASSLAKRCQQGFMSFAQFMESALYDEQAGYYSKPHAIFGSQGDYVTAPHISPAFAEAVFNTLKELSEILIDEGEHQMSTLHWFEVAAGDGLLAQQLLLLWQKNPINYFQLHYHAIEPHPIRCQQLQKTLQEKIISDDHFTWSVDNTLSDNLEGIIFANEFFDALPCEWLEWNSEGIYQLGITWQQSRSLEEGFRVIQRPVTEYPRLACAAYSRPPSCLMNGQWQLHHDYIDQDMALKSFPKNPQKTLNNVSPPLSTLYRSEINLAMEDWLHTTLAKMTRGFALFFDYGFPADEYYHPQRVQGTLKTHYQHQRVDNVLVHIGEQDITASVDFSAWAQTVNRSQAKVLGYLSLSHFMVNAGLDSFMQKCPPMSSSSWDHAHRMSRLRQLLDPNILGEAIKVGLCGKNVHANAMVGFQQYNHVERLLSIHEKEAYTASS